MVNLRVTTGKGLSRGTTDANANDELRLVGGRIHADHRPPQNMANVGVYHLGHGKNQSGGGVDSYIDSIGYRMRVPITEPTTFAQLPTDWPKEGMRGYITDGSTTTFHATVTGGGANKVPVFYDGSNWRVG
jgi:hypothetical protein